MRRAAPRLVAITDLETLDAPAATARIERLGQRARPGSVAVLLRDHATSATKRLGWGAELRALTRASQQHFWVADRLDLALLLDADGAHLGEGSVSASRARQLLGAERWLSRAWHEPGIAEAAVAELAGVDALLLSPIFTERKGRPPLAARALSALARALSERALSAHVYALGGVTSAHVAACDAAGASGVAAIGAAFREDVEVLLNSLGVLRTSGAG